MVLGEALRQIDRLDAAVLRDALRERGLLENTWIIVGSDHGDFTGEKGMFAKTESLYELCPATLPCFIGTGVSALIWLTAVRMLHMCRYIIHMWILFIIHPHYTDLNCT